MIHFLDRALVVVIIIVAGVGTASPGHGAGATLAETCSRLEDLLRIANDKIVKGDQSSRVQIALEAHRRLGCSPAGLVEALRLKAIDEREISVDTRKIE